MREHVDGFRIFTGSSEDAIAILRELLAPPKELTPAEMIQQRIDYRKQTIAVTEATIADLQEKLGRVRGRMESDQRVLDQLLDAQAAEEARQASQDINGKFENFKSAGQAQSLLTDQEAERVKERPAHYEDPTPTGFQDRHAVDHVDTPPAE